MNELLIKKIIRFPFIATRYFIDGLWVGVYRIFALMVVCICVPMLLLGMWVYSDDFNLIEVWETWLDSLKKIFTLRG